MKIMGMFWVRGMLCVSMEMVKNVNTYKMLNSKGVY